MASVLSAMSLDEAVTDRRIRGAVFTPRFLADWVAERLVKTKRPDGAIVDFGSGEGALLQAIARFSPETAILGIESDPKSATVSRQDLGGDANVITSDVLKPIRKDHPLLADYWVHRMGGRPSGVIMNPPWGATTTLSRKEAADSGLNLANGQFDTYDLFCELALQVLPEGGVFGFIVPDSILLPEHEALRRILLAQTSLSLIARLGEGIFPGVYRGCVVIIGTKGGPSPNHIVDCARLEKRHRVELHAGSSLEVCARDLIHHVPQIRFANDANCRFDLDVSLRDEAVFKIEAKGGNWSENLASRRGVELSKTGRVSVCPLCGQARPMPKSEQVECSSCGGALSSTDTQIIVSSTEPIHGSWHDFIVGEDVCRYAVVPKRWIRGGFPGINYKQQTPPGVDRILIRKTGVGINAALDTSGAYTNQVVFEYKMKPGISFPFCYLHYVLGILNSRVLFAYHLKRGGDLEWRSHPYVTQKTLAQLPIPVPVKGDPSWNQAAAIAIAVGAHMIFGDRDLEIESLVAGMYDLSASELKWAVGVIASAADLEPMRRLRLPENVEIIPLKVP